MVSPARSRRVTGVRMISSRDRILTTHVGSLPRNEKLSDLLMAQEEGKPHDPKVLADEMDKAVRHVVKGETDGGRPPAPSAPADGTRRARPRLRRRGGARVAAPRAPPGPPAEGVRGGWAGGGAAGWCPAPLPPFHDM